MTAAWGKCCPARSDQEHRCQALSYSVTRHDGHWPVTRSRLLALYLITPPAPHLLHLGSSGPHPQLTSSLLGTDFLGWDLGLRTGLRFWFFLFLNNISLGNAERGQRFDELVEDASSSMGHMYTLTLQTALCRRRLAPFLFPDS